MWTDIAAIVFASTAVNHLGLIKAVEGIIKREIPIVNCPRCLTFWGVLAYGGLSGDGLAAANPSALPWLLATAFLCSYLAIWLELLMYSIDTLYNRIYDTLNDNNQRQEGRDEDDGRTDG